MSSIFRTYRTETKKRYASDLRHKATESELHLRKSLRMHSSEKRLRFKFQYIILGFIVDFYYPKAKLVIEIDGKYHENIAQEKKDELRTDAFNKYGIKVLRFKNEDVLMRTNSVLKIIYRQIIKRCNSVPLWVKEYKNVDCDNIKWICNKQKIV